MRKVLALGTGILFVGFLSVSIAQERLQSNQSGMGVGEGVGDVSGSSTRVTTFDRTQFLDADLIWIPAAGGAATRACSRSSPSSRSRWRPRATPSFS